MEYIIKTTFGTPEFVYYEYNTTKFGPRFTEDINKAFKFTSKENALFTQGTHFGFIGSEIVPFEGE